MTTIAVLGATGRTGRRVCEYAKEAGYDVRALVRSASRVGPEHVGVHVTRGDATHADSIRAVLTGATVVISALGEDNYRAPAGTLSGAMTHVAALGPALGITRVLSVAGGGILDADDGSGQRRAGPYYPETFRAISAEHDAAWRVLVASGLEWTVACTPDIVPGTRTGVFRNGGSKMPSGGRRISCEDLAGFLVDEVAKREFVNQRVGLAY
ncbi:MAG: NAD(P)H-binding protein [Gemmatimonadetes bacterium]|nr:NAD(P)H-binding protein [Gemmatimonadota bacterium]